jgi:hypothetical protein
MGNCCKMFYHLLSQASQAKESEQAYIDTVWGLHLKLTPTLQHRRKALGGTKQGGFDGITDIGQTGENLPWPSPHPRVLAFRHQNPPKCNLIHIFVGRNHLTTCLESELCLLLNMLLLSTSYLTICKETVAGFHFFCSLS